MRIRVLALALFALAALPCAAQAQAQPNRRMVPIPADQMTKEQKAAAAEFKAARGQELKDHIFMDLLRIPEVMRGAFLMREHVRKDSVFEPKLTEMGILIVLREWSQRQEWSGHSNQARRAGLSADVVRGIAEGYRPTTMTSDEAIIYDFLTELQKNHGVSDPTYDRMVKRWGEKGVVEAINIVGLYSIVGAMLNVARESLPAAYNELPDLPQLGPAPLSTYENPVALPRPAAPSVSR